MGELERLNKGIDRSALLRHADYSFIAGQVRGECDYPECWRRFVL
jgi:hypothetical protein